MAAVKLIALDVDGTLIPPGHESLLPDAAVSAAIRELAGSGVVVVLASGRMFPGTAKVAQHLELSTPLICQQGAAVHMLDGTLLHSFPLEMEIAHEISGLARGLDRCYAWFDAIRYVASRENADSIEYGRVSGIEPEFHSSPESSGIVPTGVDVVSSTSEAAHIHRLLVHRYGERLHVLDFPAVTVAVAPDANKGHALSLLCAGLGIDRHEVVAIGDSTNDAPMLAWAGRGYAMPHSDRYALDAADEVLGGEGIEGIGPLLASITRSNRP